MQHLVCAIFIFQTRSSKTEEEYIDGMKKE